MDLIIGFLTVILVLDCFLLMLLILIQLPKKEAGAGVAFGGAATDALFGAGSGNALTKMTKYTATIFIGLALSLSLMNSNRAQSGRKKLEEELRKKMAAPSALIPPAAPAENPNAALGTPAQNPLGAQTITLPIPTNATATNQTVPAASSNAAAATVSTQATANAKPPATNSPTPNLPAPAPKP